MLNTACFAPPQPGSKGDESSRFFVRNPPTNNLDMSLSKNFAVVRSVKFEFRVDMFNALNHPQFTGVNATANFASLTDPTITNLARDASGQPGAAERVRDHQRRGAATHAADRHSGDVLIRPMGLGSVAPEPQPPSSGRSGAPPRV